MKTLCSAALVLVLVTVPANAQIIPEKESLSDLYTGKAYSPYEILGRLLSSA